MKNTEVRRVPYGVHLLTHTEIQQELLSMLHIVDEFLDRHNLRYSLSDGTLLGAVRHKGFIPWDDDIDLYLPRPDYERLMSISRELMDETGFMLLSSRNDGWHFPFTKVINPNIRAQEASCKRSEEYLWIDLFPIDGLPADPIETRKLFDRRRRLLLFSSIAVTNASKSFVKRALKIPLHVLGRLFINPYYISNKIDAFARTNDFETSERVACLVYGATFFGKSIPREGFESRVKLEFEGREYWAMSCWDEYLTKSYGDYMQLPPEEKRWTHTITAWRITDNKKGGL